MKAFKKMSGDVQDLDKMKIILPSDGCAVVVGRNSSVTLKSRPLIASCEKAENEKQGRKIVATVCLFFMLGQQVLGD